jgi:hypothetical protein
VLSTVIDVEIAVSADDKKTTFILGDSLLQLNSKIIIKLTPKAWNFIFII